MRSTPSRRAISRERCTGRVQIRRRMRAIDEEAARRGIYEKNGVRVSCKYAECIVPENWRAMSPLASDTRPPVAIAFPGYLRNGLINRGDSVARCSLASKLIVALRRKGSRSAAGLRVSACLIAMFDQKTRLFEFPTLALLASLSFRHSFAYPSFVNVYY